MQIKVAFAAGLPKTLEALLELFAPENDWQENCEFRAGLEKHLGMPPKGGMSILSTFIATTANPESMELAAAYFSGGPAGERRRRSATKLDARPLGLEALVAVHAVGSEAAAARLRDVPAPRYIGDRGGHSGDIFGSLRGTWKNLWSGALIWHF